jgi:enoyl-CoA hydratase
MTAGVVTVTTRGACAIVTLNRPDVMNALNTDLLQELNRRLDQLPDEGHRALILRGAGGRAFSAGADVANLSSGSPVDRRLTQAFARSLLEKLDTLPVITIAAIDGYALGGGLELALACTFRVASREAKLGFPEIKLALIPGYGGIQRLTRLIGLGWAQELVLTGRIVDASEAWRVGLVNRIGGDSALDAALELATEMTSLSLPALEIARRALRQSGDVPLAVGVDMDLDRSALAQTLLDSKEGMAAFLEKRSARFLDR